MNKTLAIVMIWIALSTGMYISAADGPKTGREFLTMEKVLASIRTRSPLTRQVRLDNERFGLAVKDVRQRALLPEFNLSVETGVVPEARGDVFQSPDKQTDLDGWGPFYKIDLELAQPLMTFGRTRSALNAARHAREATRILGDSRIQELLLTGITTYHALAAARKTEELARDLERDFENLVKEVRKRMEQADSEVDDDDYLEIQAHRHQVSEVLIRSRTAGRIAANALKSIMNVRELTPAKPRLYPVPEFQPSRTGVRGFIESMIRDHPRVAGLREAVDALNARAELSRAQKRPLIYLAGGVAWALAPNRADQTNPFAVDDFNYFSLGLYLGIKWDLNTLRPNLEARRLRLEARSMTEKRGLAEASLSAEMHEALENVRSNAELLDSAVQSHRAARSWLRLSMENWEMGLESVERVIRAYQTHYRMQATVIERRLECHRAQARLAYLMGDVTRVMEWIKNGKIVLD